MSEQWTDKRIHQELKPCFGDGVRLKLHLAEIVMCRMRDDLTTDLQNASRLLADCEENRGNLIAAVAELQAERDQLRTDALLRRLAAIQTREGDTYEKIHKRHQDLLDEHGELAKAYNNVIAERDDLQRRYHEANERWHKVSEAHNEIAVEREVSPSFLEQQLDRAEIRANVLQAERDQLQTLLHSQIATCKALQAELTAMQITDHQMTQHYNSLSNDYQALLAYTRRLHTGASGHGLSICLEAPEDVCSGESVSN